LKYLEVTKDEFDSIIDAARPEHLWRKKGKNWKLINPIWNKYNT